MSIWFAMAIPFIMAIILLVFFRHRTKLWEVIIPLIFSLILIFLAKTFIQTIQIIDTEYWGGWVKVVQYYEPWNEEDCHTEFTYDSEGNISGSYIDCDVEYYSAYYRIIESNDLVVRINASNYHQLVKKFSDKEQRVELNRNYHTIDGDMYQVFWDGRDETLVPVTTVHSYVNKVKANIKKFDFREVDPKKYELFDYPKVKDEFNVPCILGEGGPTMPEAERLLAFWNAKLGKDKQVRMWILVFKNKPIEAGVEQESYWLGGNKNEFVIAIGVDDNYTVQWTYPISWTKVRELKEDARTFIKSQETLDLVAIVNWLAENINERFIRKQFAEMNYLTVEPPLWSKLLVFGLTLVLNIPLSLWIVWNEYRNYQQKRW